MHRTQTNSSLQRWEPIFLSLFVTHSKTPYELRWTPPAGQEVEVIQTHLVVDVYLAALAAAWPGQTDRVEVIDFFGRDDALKARPLLRSRYGAHLYQACAAMLTGRTPGNTRRVADLTRLFGLRSLKANP